MRVVIALGGNALLRRDEPMTAERQRRNVRIAAQALAEVAQKHQIIISHGNGPQVGLLALQAAAYMPSSPYPLDVLGAETEGMIGYLLEQELGNLLPPEQPLATILTMVEVDAQDPAFQHPSKPIGPVYSQAEAEQLAAERGWTIALDGNKFRRVVPSPLPKRIFELRPIRWLLEKGTIVICAGGGGIPTMFDAAGNLQGVEAVIDKDRASALLAQELAADFFIMATDVDAVYLHWGQPNAKAIRCTSPEAIAQFEFAEGSMAPKVEAAIEFASKTGKTAAIGALSDLSKMIAGEAGTQVTVDSTAIE
ncbi:carbamate kinase [Leptolyngbya ohadii]|uniref:carbamate kinase n=1 Tax=Leptolyngbya ohadii TaxID=1962290 RepID=UPI000B5A145B|nr:carbamate kinase [Leptolyngbya ohadii]